MVKLVLKKDFCKSCQLCINFCPQGILELDQKLNKLGFQPVRVKDESKCKACMRCVLICPEACIEIYQEVESRD